MLFVMTVTDFGNYTDKKQGRIWSKNMSVSILNGFFIEQNIVHYLQKRYIFFTAYFIGNEENLYVDGKIKNMIPVEKPPM